MEIELKPLEPCFIGPVKVKVLASGERGKGWCSPFPQLYIDIGKTGVAIIGYENIELIRDMCNHALSRGPWDDSPPDETIEPCTPYTHKWVPAGEHHTVCEKCLNIGTRLGYLQKEEWYQQHLAKIIANIIINDLLKHCNEKNCKVKDLGLESEDIAWLAGLIYYDVLDRSKVSKIIDYFIKNGGEMQDIIVQLGLWPTYGDNKLEAMVDKVMAENPKAVKEILAGKKQALGFLMGKLKQVDKNIDSKEAMLLLKEKIDG